MLNPLNYRFQLRKDARWQDLPPVGGRRLVASDLVFSYQRQRTEGWPNAPLISGMDTVKAEGDSTLKVTLKFPDVDFLLALADGHSKVVAREVAQGPGGLKEGPVIGTGPWTLRHTAKGVGSDFEPNPNYYEDRLPLLRHLSFKVIEDADVRLAAFVTGSVDVYDLLPQEWAVLQATEADYKTFQSRQGGRGLVLAMNVNRPPFNDGNLRRGVFKALDPWANLEEIWAGQGFVGAGVPVVEADWLLDRPELGKLFGGPPAFGSRPGDVAIVFDLMVADFGDVYLDQGLSVERDLRSAGFDPRLRVLNPIEYSELVWERKEYQLFVGPVPPATSPNSYLFSVLHSGGQWNILAHNDPVLNGLIESQQRAPFRSIERGETFRAIQRHLLEQAYMFGLVGHATTWALQQRVEGLYPNTALSEYFYWAEAWVVDD
jgi:peptide/nickel transport system substrate-binding protein